jgi:hypothetical protein
VLRFHARGGPTWASGRRFTARATDGKTRAPLKPTLEGERRDQTEKTNGEAMRQLACSGAKTPSRDFFRGSYEQTVRRAPKTPGKAREKPSIPRRAEKQTVVGESFSSRRMR